MGKGVIMGERFGGFNPQQNEKPKKKKEPSPTIEEIMRRRVEANPQDGVADFQQHQARMGDREESDEFES
jgi:hypothetical protein